MTFTSDLSNPSKASRLSHPSAGHTVLRLGLPKETKPSENRVALTPSAVRDLTSFGVEVFVETSAGLGSGFPDELYRSAGATIVDTAEAAWAQPLVVKVKEPQPSELRFLREDLVLFTYLHLAAYPTVASALLESRTTALAYETVQLESGALPLLAPMSEIAGRLAPQLAAQHLMKHEGGRGVLFAGAPGVRPATVSVVGAGLVGLNAASIASGMGAEVLLFDTNIDRLRAIDAMRIPSVRTVFSSLGSLEEAVLSSDVVIGAVLVPGAKAPRVVSEAMVMGMRPGSVVLDVAVDQGGCIETIHETSHLEPTYVLHDVLHYAVGNMPGAVPRTSTYALSNVTLPYIRQVATLGVRGAMVRSPELLGGLNTMQGLVTNRSVAEALGLPFAQPASLGL
jgi:alanine dehydrogenase